MLARLFPGLSVLPEDFGVGGSKVSDFLRVST
jgi:hypothetical protein